MKRASLKSSVIVIAREERPKRSLDKEQLIFLRLLLRLRQIAMTSLWDSFLICVRSYTCPELRGDIRIAAIVAS